ncbi:hypothetical protein NQ315_015283 [Exocentrus adspersus]|uniref:ODAD1 central coiled coil region domain-containing protein n=1 Tax=Exocentrus adspersus TaxID=1586481 RepID=A0AAV8VAV0_9CUCU|nr:hypothetical protein NQ315_015283 [Exocentrus adspersus]
MKKTVELTEEDKFDLALQAEQDVRRLERTYTILERNRAQFAFSGGKIAKQRKVLDIFRNEQRNILTDLHVATAGGRKFKDEKLFRQLKGLLREYDEYCSEIKKLKAFLNEIDGQIQIVKKSVMELQAEQITDYNYQQRVMKSENTLQTLENKLEMQTKKFCAISSENNKLREEINHLLIERMEFNKIWDTLISNLCRGKKFMLDLIEQATIAYDQREEWVSKLQSLRTKAHNDLLSHIQEMRELQRRRDHCVKLQEFLAVRGQKRIMKDLEEKQLKKRLENKQKMEAKLEKYLQIMIAIKEFTGQDLIQTIAHEFLVQEEENFAMFKYINHMNKDLEEMSDNLGCLHLEIEEQKAVHDAWRNQQNEKLEGVKNRFEEAKNETEEKKVELDKVEKKLAVIMKGIDQLFKLFRCNKDPLVQLLGHNDTINYYNVLLYLEILEQNIQKALVTVYQKEMGLLKKKKIRHDQLTIPEMTAAPVIEPIEKIAVTNPCPLCLEHELVNDVIDKLQFACDKKMTQEKLEKRKDLEGAQDKLHNVSACHLPKSREIIQKRYQ